MPRVAFTSEYQTAQNVLAFGRTDAPGVATEVQAYVAEKTSGHVFMGTRQH
jgi:hypothetical protein